MGTKTRIAAFTVAVAALGVAPGQAAKPPKTVNQLTIAASRTQVKFGSTAAITGHLTATPNAGIDVTLQQNPYPFAGFKSLPTVVKTDAAGNYTFTVRPLVITQFRSTAKSKPPATSAVQLVKVVINVGLKASDTTPAKGQKVRFSGLVAPAENGRSVAIERRTSSGSFRAVARTTLVDAGGGRSKFSRKLRITRSGVYRAKVNGDPSILTGISRTVRLKVH